MKNLISVVAVLAVSSGMALAEESIDRTIAVDPNVIVEIDNVAGSIRVSGWDRNEVHITGSMGDDVESVDISEGPGRVTIEVDVPDGRGRRWRGSNDIEVRLEVQMPSGGELEASGVSAGIRVEGVHGRLELDSVSGSVEARSDSEEIDAESVSGSVRIYGSGSTRVDAESVSGSVVVEGAAEEVSVSTVSGRIEVEASEVSRCDLESVSGSISFDGAIAPNARFEVSSHSGNITLTLPSSTSADFDLSTFSGEVESDFEMQIRSGRFTPGKDMRFTTGAGGARVRIETFSGNVRLRNSG